MSFTSDFNGFTARLGEFISIAECGVRSAEWEVTSEPHQPPSDHGSASVGSGNLEFDSLALELFGLQFKYNAPYRRFCEARGMGPATVQPWSQIPAAPTAAFKELELSCLPIAERTIVFHSSGTTEHRPSRHFHSAESLAVYEASLWSWFPLKEKAEMARRQKQKHLLILTPPPSQAPHSSLVHMFETLRRRMGSIDSAYAGVTDDAGAWTLNLEATIEVLRKFKDTNAPALLLGTASSFVHLLDVLAERELDLELPSCS